MIYNAIIGNGFTVTGRIAKINMFGNGKAANISVAVRDPNGKKENNQTDACIFVNMVCFCTKVIPFLKKGTLVQVNGHIGSAEYVKDGTTYYKDNNDLIADAVQIIEPSYVVQTREIRNKTK